MTEVTTAEGLGDLLATALTLTDQRGKPEIKSVDLPDGAKALVSLGHGADHDTQVDILDATGFDEWRGKPLTRRANPTLTNLDSFIDYIDRFKDDDSLVFANDSRESPSIVAALDYHRAGPADNGGQRFIRHSATFPVPLSDEWKGWNECDGKTLQMPEFARFLEDHIIDVMYPNEAVFSPDQGKFVETLGGLKRMADPAKLMELATGLQIFEEGQVTQAVKLNSGEAQIQIESAHRDAQGQQLLVPSMFTIAIPVFRGGEPYQIVVRLRYRKTAQGILFFYELWRADRVFDHAFNEACDKIVSTTGVKVLRGAK